MPNHVQYNSKMKPPSESESPMLQQIITLTLSKCSILERVFWSRYFFVSGKFRHKMCVFNGLFLT